MNDANLLNGEELGVVENQHARQVKEADRTRTEALQSTITCKAAAATKDDIASAVDTLRTEFSEANDLSGFRKTRANGDDDIDKGVRFGRADQFAGSTPPHGP